jgi:hypothetical protein
MSTTRSIDAEFVHIPPPPTPPRRHAASPLRQGHRDLLGAFGEASLLGMAALAFSWGLAELAFVLLSR